MIFFIISFFLTLFSSTIEAKIEQDPTKRPELVSTSLATYYEANYLFKEMSFPLSSVTDSFTKDIFTKIDNAYGPSGLNLTQKQIDLIKKAYLYLIFLTKLHKVKTSQAPTSSKSSFSSFLKDNNQPFPHMPDEQLVTSQGWNDILLNSQDVTQSPMWQLFCKSMISEAYLFFYNALDIIHDVEGQTFNYIPHIETSFYDHDYTSLRHINELIRVKLNVEIQSKNYFLQQCTTWNKLPTIDPNQKEQDKNQTMEAALLLFRRSEFYQNSHNIHNLLGIPNNNQSTISTQQLMSPKQLASPLKEHVWCFFMLKEVAKMLFSQIETNNLDDVLYYASTSGIVPNVFPYTQDDYPYFEDMLAIKSKNEGTHTQSVHPSPPTHKLEDAHAPIAWASNSHKLRSQQSKKVTIQSKTKQKKESKVIQQNIFDDIGSAFSSLGDDIKKGAEDVGDAVVDTAKAIGGPLAAAYEGTIGLGANILGTITGDKSISKFGDKAYSDAEGSLQLDASIGETIAGGVASVVGNVVGSKTLTQWGSGAEKEAVKNLQSVTKNLEGAVNNLSDSVAEASKFAENISVGLEVDLASVVLDDQKLGEDFNDMINQATSALTAVGAKLGDTIIQAQSDIDVGTLRISERFANIVASTALVVFTAGQDGKNEWLQNGKSLLGSTLNAIVNTFQNLLTNVESMMMPVMQALAAITNSLTSMFINISKEITFIAAVSWDLTKATFSGKHNFKGAITDAEQTRNVVSNKLNEHRQAINQVMGVAVAVVFTGVSMVASGGSAGPEDAAIDAELIAGDVGEDAAANVAEDAGKEVAESTAKNIGEDAAKQGAEDTGKEVAKNVTEDAAKETTEETTSNAVKDAAKQVSKRIMPKGAKEALEKAAQKAVDDLGEDASEQEIKEAAQKGAQKALDDATKRATEKALQKGAQKLAQKTTEDMAKKLTTQTAKDAFKEATEQAIKESAEDIGQQTFDDIGKGVAKSIAKQAAEQAQKDAAKKIAETVYQRIATRVAEATAEGVDTSSDEFAEELSNIGKEAAEDAGEDATKDAAENAARQALKQGAKTVVGYSVAAIGNVINIVFGTFNVISGLNSDAQNEQQEKQQTANITNMWEYVNNNKVSLAQTQQAFLDEMQLKQQATVGNQTLALAFAKNSTYASVNKISEQLSQALAKQIIPMLTPDSDNMIPANIGSSWGIESNYINLYPTEGFSTTTTGRPDFPFAQEVAEAPYSAKVPTKKTASSVTSLGKKSSGPSKMWFNQKVIALDKLHENGTSKKPTDPLNVTIDLQFIYTVNGPFSVGLYLAGAYHDFTSSQYLNELKKSESFDTDLANLAKMVVLTRSSQSAPLQIGIYENEGKEWIIKETLPETMQMKTHHTYHLETSLDKESLSITVWVDDDMKNEWKKTVSVTEVENQRTYGVISSGAAIQWNQISPAPSTIINRQARSPLKQKNEIAREKASKIKIAQMSNPTFGSMVLKPFSEQGVMFGQYLYTTESTNLAKITPKNKTDYVVFATNSNGVFSDIGSAPSDSPSTIIVSVITGNAYNIKGTVVAHAGNLWKTYSKEFGPFDSALDEAITSLQKTILAGLARITFGSFDLDIISNSALGNSQFIYSSDKTITIKDAQGKAITDYVIMAEITKDKLGSSIGMPPTAKNAQGILSLVTGNLYDKTTTIPTTGAPTPIAKGYAELYDYENKFGQLSTQAMNAVQSAQKTYNSATAARAKAKSQKPKIKPFPIVKTSARNMASSTQATASSGPSITLNTDSSDKGKISSLQKQAAGKVGIQLPNNKPSGPTIKL